MQLNLQKKYPIHADDLANFNSELKNISKKDLLRNPLFRLLCEVDESLPSFQGFNKERLPKLQFSDSEKTGPMSFYRFFAERNHFNYDNAYQPVLLGRNKRVPSHIKAFLSFLVLGVGLYFYTKNYREKFKSAVNAFNATSSVAGIDHEEQKSTTAKLGEQGVTLGSERLLSDEAVAPAVPVSVAVVLLLPRMTLQSGLRASDRHRMNKNNYPV